MSLLVVGQMAMPGLATERSAGLDSEDYAVLSAVVVAKLAERQRADGQREPTTKSHAIVVVGKTRYLADGVVRHPEDRAIQIDALHESLVRRNRGAITLEDRFKPSALHVAVLSDAENSRLSAKDRSDAEIQRVRAEWRRFDEKYPRAMTFTFSVPSRDVAGAAALVYADVDIDSKNGCSKGGHFYLVKDPTTNGWVVKKFWLSWIS